MDNEFKAIEQTASGEGINTHKKNFDKKLHLGGKSCSGKFSPRWKVSTVFLSFAKYNFCRKSVFQFTLISFSIIFKDFAPLLE